MAAEDLLCEGERPGKGVADLRDPFVHAGVEVAGFGDRALAARSRLVVAPVTESVGSCHGRPPYLLISR
jgi:hypothetical protein